MRVCPTCDTSMQPSRPPFVVRCPACDYMGSNLGAGSGEVFAGLDDLRRIGAARLLDELAALRPLSGATLFEVGCATGVFLEAAKAKGMLVSGIEPTTANALLARAKGLNVVGGLFPADVPAGHTYDAIVYNDVFEHLPNPVMASQGTAKMLRPGGIAIVNLPSSGGVIYRVASLLAAMGLSAPMDRLWQVGQDSPHLSYFNADNLSRLFARHAQLEPIATIRMPTLTRAGLHDRIMSTWSGVRGEMIFSATWLTSWALNVLPPDLIAVFFRKRA